MSLSYPNVNRHIFAPTPAANGPISSNTACDATVRSVSPQQPPVQEVCPGVEGKRRISAPPPYAEEDPKTQPGGIVGSKVSAACKCCLPGAFSLTILLYSPLSFTRLQKLAQGQIPLLLEVAVGHKLASTLTQKFQSRRLARLEKAHDGWMRLGVDTRLIMSQGGQLPPFFHSPPHCGPQEMSARMAQMGF
jgi:hypothetical protein